jgi:hypothetical protein
MFFDLDTEIYRRVGVINCFTFIEVDAKDEGGVSGTHLGCLYSGEFICKTANLYPLLVDGF